MIKAGYTNTHLRTITIAASLNLGMMKRVRHGMGKLDDCQGLRANDVFIIYQLLEGILTQSLGMIPVKGTREFAALNCLTDAHQSLYVNDNRILTHPMPKNVKVNLTHP
jgi:hypothetical protein